MNPIVEKVYQIGIIPVIAFNSVDEALQIGRASVGKECRSRWSPYH